MADGKLESGVDSRAAEPNHAKLARAGIRKSTASCVHEDVPNRFTADAARRRREVVRGAEEDSVSALPSSGGGSRAGASRLPGRSATIVGLSRTLHARPSPPRRDVLDALINEEPGRQIRILYEVPPMAEVRRPHGEHLTYAPIVVSLQEGAKRRAVEVVFVPDLPEGPRFGEVNLPM